VNAKDVVVTDLGSHVLKGIHQPVSIHQLSLSQPPLSMRAFPPLRLHKARDSVAFDPPPVVVLDNSSSSTTTSSSTGSSSTASSMLAPPNPPKEKRNTKLYGYSNEGSILDGISPAARKQKMLAEEEERRKKETDEFQKRLALRKQNDQESTK